jgi:perosamine synthetase
MLITNDGYLANRVRELNNHGRKSDEKKQFWASEPAYKFKMTNVQAAVGLAQLSRIEKLVSRKREIMDFYRLNLAIPFDLGFNPVQEGVESGSWMPNIVIPKSFGFGRDQLLAEFRRRGIDARVFFWPLSELPFMESHQATPMAHHLSDQSINLPSFHDINLSQLEQVTLVVKGLLKA